MVVSFFNLELIKVDQGQMSHKVQVAIVIVLHDVYSLFISYVHLSCSWRNRLYVNLGMGICCVIDSFETSHFQGQKMSTVKRSQNVTAQFQMGLWLTLLMNFS